MAKLELPSAWLRSTDVEDGDLVTITGEHRVRPAEETPFGREVIEVPVKLKDGTEKTWTMNKTTLRTLMEAWGSDTKNWVGKKVQIMIREQPVRGSLKKVLYGKPAKP